MDPIEVPETIPVGVEERDGVYLVYDGGFPPSPLCSTERGMVGVETFEGDGGRRHGRGGTRSVVWASCDTIECRSERRGGGGTRWRCLQFSFRDFGSERTASREPDVPRFQKISSRAGIKGGGR